LTANGVVLFHPYSKTTQPIAVLPAMNTQFVIEPPVGNTLPALGSTYIAAGYVTLFGTLKRQSVHVMPAS
jgi:hypothetical protein